MTAKRFLIYESVLHYCCKRQLASNHLIHSLILPMCRRDIGPRLVLALPPCLLIPPCPLISLSAASQSATTHPCMYCQFSSYYPSLPGLSSSATRHIYT